MHKQFIYLCGILLAGSGILITLLWHTFPRNMLDIYALGIGQGDSMLIRTPGGKHILIDGGPGADILTELPKALGPYQRRIDLLIISHPDSDHINGLIDVIPRYEISGVLMTSTPSDSLAYRQLQILLAYHHIPIYYAHPKQDIELDPQVWIDVLYPWEDLLHTESLDKNDASVVFRLIYGDTSLLMMGDAEEEAETLILRTGQSLRSTLLKLGHHGSRTSTSQALVNAVQPKYSLLQYGLDNSYGHPHQEAVNRVSHTTIFDSARGTIHVQCDAYEQCSLKH